MWQKPIGGGPEGNVGITETAVEKENGENQAEDKKKRKKENTLLGYGGALREGFWMGWAFWRVEDGLVSSSC